MVHTECVCVVHTECVCVVHTECVCVVHTECVGVVHTSRACSVRCLNRRSCRFYRGYTRLGLVLLDASIVDLVDFIEGTHV